MPPRRIAKSPPRTRLAFRVGVVGHRPHKLVEADIATLLSRFATILNGVGDAVRRFHAAHPHCYDNAPPVLRAISPLAEGTDRLFAEEALARGYELCCPMPFFEDAFTADFASGTAQERDSLAHFRRLLNRAREGAGLTRFELDGDRATPGAAYAAAGIVVVNQSDLLVVVWDGRPEGGRGGTLESVREALAVGVPVVWVDSTAPHACQLLPVGAALPPPQATGRMQPSDDCVDLLPILGEVVHGILAPPPAAGDDITTAHRHAGDMREEFFRERQPAWNPWFLWKMLRDLLGENRVHVPVWRSRDFELSVQHDWPTTPADAPERSPSAIEMWVNSRLRPHFAWADRLADLYADKYRSAFTLVYALAAMAVLLALLPIAAKELLVEGDSWSVGFAWSEGVTVLALLAFLRTGRARRWHDRWLDYRLLAELVRELRILLPLGGGRPTPRQPAHRSAYGDPVQSWMFWHLRGIARETGLPNARLSSEHLAQSVAYLREVVSGVSATPGGQIRFHQDTARMSARIHRRLHRATVVAFGLTVACVAGHLLLDAFPDAMPAVFSRLPGLEWWAWLKPAFWVGTAFLPAVGAAVAGLMNQGEFARTAKRSEAMAARFAELDRELEVLEHRINSLERVQSAKIADVAARAAQLMVDEVLDWRVVYLHRPLEQP